MPRDKSPKPLTVIPKPLFVRILQTRLDRVAREQAALAEVPFYVIGGN